MTWKQGFEARSQSGLAGDTSCNTEQLRRDRWCAHCQGRHPEIRLCCAQKTTTVDKMAHLMLWSENHAHVRQNGGDPLCLDSTYALGIISVVGFVVIARVFVSLLEWAFANGAFFVLIKIPWPCSLFIILPRYYWHRLTVLDCEGVDWSTPPPTLCQGPARPVATLSCCDAWGTLRSAGTPLFGEN